MLVLTLTKVVMGLLFEVKRLMDDLGDVIRLRDRSGTAFFNRYYIPLVTGFDFGVA